MSFLFRNDKSKIGVLEAVYPIGSIYMSVNSANPSTLFGGTWESWGAGRVPVGVNANDTDFNTVEKTGGEKTHTLTATEIPSHAHKTTSATTYAVSGLDARAAASGSNFAAYYDHGVNNLNTLNTGNAGGNGAHNNLQPYITCYMWKRTA